MRDFPSRYPNEPKVCSVCKLTVARKDCHKNRYGEYLCNACLAAGVRFTPGQRLRYGTRRAVWWFWLGVAGVVSIGMLAWIAYAFFTHLDSLRFFKQLFGTE